MEIWNNTKELIAGLADVTEAGSKIARFKIEVANLDRKLSLAFRRIGERTYQLQVDGQTDILSDPGVRAALDEVQKMRARMENIRQEVEKAKKKAFSEWDRASKAVKEEAGRASKVVRREADRAVTLIKDETTRATSALKRKTARKKETTVKKASARKKAPARKKASARKEPAAKSTSGIKPE